MGSFWFPVVDLLIVITLNFYSSADGINCYSGPSDQVQSGCLYCNDSTIASQNGIVKSEDGTVSRSYYPANVETSQNCLDKSFVDDVINGACTTSKLATLGYMSLESSHSRFVEDKVNEYLKSSRQFTVNSRALSTNICANDICNVARKEVFFDSVPANKMDTNSNNTTEEGLVCYTANISLSLSTWTTSPSLAAGSSSSVKAERKNKCDYCIQAAVYKELGGSKAGANQRGWYRLKDTTDVLACIRSEADLRKVADGLQYKVKQMAVVNSSDPALCPSGLESDLNLLSVFIKTQMIFCNTSLCNPFTVFRFSDTESTKPAATPESTALPQDATPELPISDATRSATLAHFTTQTATFLVIRLASGHFITKWRLDV